MDTKAVLKLLLIKITHKGVLKQCSQKYCKSTQICLPIEQFIDRRTKLPHGINKICRECLDKYKSK